MRTDANHISRLNKQAKIKKISEKSSENSENTIDNRSKSMYNK